MCHSDDSRAPAPPVIGEVGEHGRFTLTAADASTSAAFGARAVGGNGMNIVILPDVRGLHPFYEDLAQRFAEAGFDTVAIDYFGRELGVEPRAEDFDWQPYIKNVTPEHVALDVAAAAAHLQQSNPGPVFTVGFCFGGSNSWRLAASSLELAGTIGFYGRPSMLADVLPTLTKPMLMLVAGADQATPVADFHDMDARLTEMGTAHEMYVYDGAPHSYFDRSFAQWADACNDSWRRILDFTTRFGS